MLVGSQKFPPTRECFDISVEKADFKKVPSLAQCRVQKTFDMMIQIDGVQVKSGW